MSEIQNNTNDKYKDINEAMKNEEEFITNH